MTSLALGASPSGASMDACVAVTPMASSSRASMPMTPMASTPMTSVPTPMTSGEGPMPSTPMTSIVASMTLGEGPMASTPMTSMTKPVASMTTSGEGYACLVTSSLHISCPRGFKGALGVISKALNRSYQDSFCNANYFAEHHFRIMRP